jgi:hypothetical protein
MSQKAIRLGLLLKLMLLAVYFVFSRQSFADVTVERSPNGAVVKIDGRLFTEYLIDSGGKPILWPIIGPTGKSMTRSFPMEKVPGEKIDHPHHRSLWFAHGAVNKIDFWTEKKGNGIIKHHEFVKLEGGKTGLIVTRNDWMSSDGKPQCEDTRTFRFGADGGNRWIDFNITIKALDKPVVFGDTKEGTFGLRLVEPLTVDAKKGGRIVNGNGQINGSAWGKAADWIDASGPLDGQIVGVAIFNHPGCFRFPTYWHAREYGLLAANPFGIHDFSGDKKKDGSYTLPPDQQITLCYRVLLHTGDEKEGNVAEAYSSYSKEAK